MQTNGDVQQIHQQNSIYAIFTVYYIIPHLTLHGMVKSLASTNLGHLDVIYIPSHNILKSYMTKHKNNPSCVTQTAEPQLNSVTHTPIN